MTANITTTNDWVRKAEDELRCAQLLLGANEQLWDALCYHCRQCVLAYLEALAVAGAVRRAPALLDGGAGSCPELAPLTAELAWLATLDVDGPPAGDDDVAGTPRRRERERRGRRAFDVALDVRRFCRERLDVECTETLRAGFHGYLNPHVLRRGASRWELAPTAAATLPGVFEFATGAQATCGRSAARG